MASITEVINLKKLGNQLTAVEFDQFLVKLPKSIGKEIVLKLLLSQFIKSTSIDNEQSLLNEMKTIISNIIQSRKKMVIQQRNVNKIDDIPSPLIGEIGSYLKQKDYSSFSRTNRSIFVASNTPNTLKQVQLNNKSSHKSIKLQNYPQITSLGFRLYRFNKIAMNEKSILNHLETIMIDGEKSKTNDIQQFVNQTSINLSNLKSVFLYDFKMRFASISGLFSQFKMIDHLFLDEIKITDEINSDELMKLFPNLTELSLFGIDGSFPNTMLTHYGSNLQCLSFDEDSIDDDIDYDQINFMKLRRLLAVWPSINTMNDILKTAKGLREVAMAPYHSSGSSMSIDEIKSVITKIIFDQSALEFLYISTKMDDLEAICNAIESALYKTNKRKRDILEIALEIDCREKFDAQDFMILISRIIDKLNGSDTDNFMVHFECNKHKKFDFDVMMKAINDYMVFTPTVQLIKSTKLRFIIGNKECKMHQHRRWWNDIVRLSFYD